MDFDREFLIDLYSDQFSLDKQELGESLKDLQDKSEIKKALTERAKSKLDASRKNLKDQIYGRATREQRESAEKLIREKLKIDAEGKLDEILDSYVSKQQGSNEKSSTKKDLTLEDMLKQESLREHIKNKYLNPFEELKSKLEQERSAREADKMQWALSQRQKEALKEIGATFSDDPAIYKKQLKAHNLLMSEHKFKQFDDGDFYAVDEHGERVLSENGFDYVKYTDIAKQNWMFGFKEKESTTSNRTPNPNENSFNATKFGIKKEEANNGKILYSKLKEAKARGDQEAVKQITKALKEAAK